MHHRESRLEVTLFLLSRFNHHLYTEIHLGIFFRYRDDVVDIEGRVDLYRIKVLREYLVYFELEPLVLEVFLADAVIHYEHAQVEALERVNRE